MPTFLQRIINSGGHIEREMAVGNGRTDLAVYFNKQIFVLELKINRDNYTKEDGLEQLSRYLDSLGQEKGYLIQIIKWNSYYLLIIVWWKVI